MSTPVTTSLNARRPVSPADRVAVRERGRICAHDGCDTILSVYNPGKYCSTHATDVLNRPRRGSLQLARRRACEHCGEEFETRNLHRRYCSDRCRMAAFACRRRTAERTAGLLQEQAAEPTARRTQRLVGDAAMQYRTEAGMNDYYDSEIELLGDIGVLTVAGETDLATSTQFRGDLAETMEAASGDVVLDLTDLELVDSTALGIMMAAAGQMMAEQRSLVLVVARSHVLRVFAITGLLAFFSIVPSRTEAMVRLASSKVA